MEEPLIFLHGFEQELAFTLIDAVKKAVLDAGFDPNEIAFAASTPQNREWMVKKLINQVRTEHVRLHTKAKPKP
ncbi:DUF3783 domain-containing protein [Breznakiellaceae bacterium SP9]